jgi:hypothetical protein
MEMEGSDGYVHGVGDAGVVIVIGVDWRDEEHQHVFPEGLVHVKSLVRVPSVILVGFRHDVLQTRHLRKEVGAISCVDDADGRGLGGLAG